jgi:hypothetical protein
MSEKTDYPDYCPACSRFYHLLNNSDGIAKRTDDCVETKSDAEFAVRRENAKKLEAMKAKRP